MPENERTGFSYRRSPFPLIQENLIGRPWAVCISSIMLARTHRNQVVPVLEDLLDLWPDEAAFGANAEPHEVEGIVNTLGFGSRRTSTLMRFTADWNSFIAGGRLPTVHELREMNGVGKYVSDAYEMFCIMDFSSVQPEDKELKWYMEWLAFSNGAGRWPGPR
jgi:adenine-specific DNA glycosylase